MIPLVISFSGGRTSAYMTKLLLDKYSGKREILVIYANTGKEREETLEFIHNCDLHFGFKTVWIETVMRIGKYINGKKHIFTNQEWKRIKRRHSNNQQKRLGWCQTNLLDTSCAAFNIGCTFKVVDFKTASRKGEPFEDIIQKFGIPNPATPHCSREMKKNPITKYIQSTYNWGGGI